MKLKLALIGLGLTCVITAGTMLAQTAPATKPATVPAASVPASSTTSKPASTSAPASTNATARCLRCHPWDKVIAASAKYVTPEGEKSNPHIYVPHKSTKVEDIPECLKCHTNHSVSPLPKKGDIDLKKLNIKWCYDACHHEKNLERCDKCH